MNDNVVMIIAQSFSIFEGRTGRDHSRDPVHRCLAGSSRDQRRARLQRHGASTTPLLAGTP
jgi:hypothetical protein